MNRWVRVAALVVGLAGCGGVDEGEFIPNYAQSYCDLYMECADQAQIVFDGFVVEDCLAVVGPELESTSSACKYKKKAAKECLELIDLISCPAEGQEIDSVLPASCGEVYVKCLPIAGDSETDAPTSADTTAD